MMPPENMLSLVEQVDQVLNHKRRLPLDHTHSPIYSWAPNLCDTRQKAALNAPNCRKSPSVGV